MEKISYQCGGRDLVVYRKPFFFFFFFYAGRQGKAKMMLNSYDLLLLTIKSYIKLLPCDDELFCLLQALLRSAVVTLFDVRSCLERSRN